MSSFVPVPVRSELLRPFISFLPDLGEKELAKEPAKEPPKDPPETESALAALLYE